MAGGTASKTEGGNTYDVEAFLQEKGLSSDKLQPYEQLLIDCVRKGTDERTKTIAWAAFTLHFGLDQIQQSIDDQTPLEDEYLENQIGILVDDIDTRAADYARQYSAMTAAEAEGAAYNDQAMDIAPIDDTSRDDEAARAMIEEVSRNAKKYHFIVNHYLNQGVDPNVVRKIAKAVKGR